MFPQVIIAAAGLVALVSSSCSFDDAGLLDWDTIGAWDTKVPEKDEMAIIRTGKHVRLNVSPPDLKGITIEKDASLVWGNYANLVVTTDHIHIQGKFIIGDSDCRFTNKAHIRLTGKSNSNNTVAKFGMKFIGVDESGTIELHGAVKKTWTKLIQTMPAAVDTCGAAFNFKESIFNNEMGTGLFVMVFNLDGSVYDFGAFRTNGAGDSTAEDKFESFIEGVPDNKVLVIAVNGDLGTRTLTRDWEKIYTAVETVGGLAQTELRNVMGREAYAFITKTGDSTSTQEQYVANTFDEDLVSTDRLKLYEATSNLEFSVVGNVFNNSRQNRGLDIRVLTEEVAFPKIALNDDVTSWNTGDKIIVASTDFDWRQVEEFELIDCTDCSDNEVRLNHAFEYLHYGETTQGVDQRAEVGVLSQSILIEGVMEDECYENDEKDAYLCKIFKKDTHGGHLKIIKGFAAAHIENVEVYHMGQQKFVGSYSLHFHMCDEAEGNWFRSNSIHHSHTRCVTIHGTDKSEASGNLCYFTKGHSFFIEDSAELYNILDGNLVIGTEHGTHLLSDMRTDWVDEELKMFTDSLSSFWLTHPTNYIRNNVAAGSEHVGYWYIVANEPLGPSKARQEERQLVGTRHAYHSKILEFDNNAAHSCRRGLRIDHRISNGEEVDGVYVPENGVIVPETSHVPKDPPEPNGTPTTSFMTRFRAYKNRDQNVWTKAGNLVMEEFSLADSPRGLAMARSAKQTYTEIRNSLFIGESENIGLPKEPWGRSFPSSASESLQGVKFYQGPGYVKDCFFDKFTHKYDGSTFRPAGAVSFKRSSHYPSAPNSGVSGIEFGFCDGPDTNWVFQGNASLVGFSDKDGNRQASFHDYDGSVTGTAGTQVVQNDRFFTTDRCLSRESWNVNVCPYEYARTHFRGSGGVFETKLKNFPMYMRRDDRPVDAFALRGEKENNYLVLKNMSYTVYFNGTTPDEVNVRGENLQTGDFVRVGFCFSPDSEFTFSSRFPAINDKHPAIQVNSITELDDDTTGRAYYWDSAAGLLFVKVIGFSPVLNKENCPGMKCPSITVTITAGTAGEYDCYDAAYGDGKYTKQEDTTTPIPTPRECSIKTYQGYGAPILPDNYPTEAYNPACQSQPTYPAPVHQGCFIDVVSYRDLPHDPVELPRAMTIDVCTARCYERNYAYAALQNGDECFCGNLYGAYGEAPDDCIKPCSGDPAQMCGGAQRNSVYSTGRAPLADLATCGPDSTGSVIDNKCYYLTSESGLYTDGQRACVKLGGNLATITSADIQFGVQRLMRPHMVDAWFGLNDIAEEGTRVYVDGTPVGNYDNTMIGQGGTDNSDGYVVHDNALYHWSDRKVTGSNQALCEMAIDAVAPSGVICGTNGYGNKFGSGSCYVVLNTPMKRPEAEYACYTRMGTLVTVDDQNREEILKHIYVYGDSIDYWTAERDAENLPYELDFSTLYDKGTSFNGKANGVVCLLETLSASNPCSTDWEEFNDMCYLYTGRFEGSFDKAVKACKQGVSDIVTIHSEAENEFVSTLVNNFKATNVYIGFKYSATSGTFEWTDGSDNGYNNWSSGHGYGNIVNGECARIRTSDATWKNRNCNKGGNVVCQAPSGQ